MIVIQEVEGRLEGEGSRTDVVQQRPSARTLVVIPCAVQLGPSLVRIRRKEIDIPLGGIHMPITRFESPFATAIRLIIVHLVHPETELRNRLSIEHLTNVRWAESAGIEERALWVLRADGWTETAVLTLRRAAKDRTALGSDMLFGGRRIQVVDRDEQSRL